MRSLPAGTPASRGRTTGGRRARAPSGVPSRGSAGHGARRRTTPAEPGLRGAPAERRREGGGGGARARAATGSTARRSPCCARGDRGHGRRPGVRTARPSCRLPGSPTTRRAPPPSVPSSRSRRAVVTARSRTRPTRDRDGCPLIRCAEPSSRGEGREPLTRPPVYHAQAVGHGAKATSRDLGPVLRPAPRPCDGRVTRRPYGPIRAIRSRSLNPAVGRRRRRATEGRSGRSPDLELPCRSLSPPLRPVALP